MPSRLLLPLVAVAALLVAPQAGRATAAVPASSSTAPVAAPDLAAGTDITVTLPSGRSYILFRPTRPNARPGLVVSLHHRTGNALGTEAHTNLDAGAGTTGNYVAYPESGSGSWNAGQCCTPASSSGVDDVAFLDQLLDDALARTGVAEGRVAMAGFSNGGMMSYRYSCERPARVSMIFPDGATNVAGCARTTPVSVFHVHGALDLTVPWLGGVSSSTALLGVKLPSVLSVIGGSAALDRCTGGFVQDKTPKGADRWTAQGCPTGIQVVVLRSANMGHYWPAGPQDAATYGVDATSVLWSMAAGKWATS